MTDGPLTPRGVREELVCASANPAKVVEIQAVLDGLRISLAPRPVGLADVDETGTTLEANARLKAEAVALAAGRAAVADDTGLEVAALNGAPGVYSARYAGEPADSNANIAKLLAALERLGALSPADRRARFRTVIVVRWPDGREVVAEGTVSGWIGHVPLGENGFGYDSVFVPDDGNGLTFAQMDPERKHSMSHRGRALRSLAELLA